MGYVQEIVRAQRYYFAVVADSLGFAATTTHAYADVIRYPVPMRTTPSIAGSYPTGGGTLATVLVTSSASGLYNSATNWSAGNAISISATFDADL